jgi:hypothetical protein
MIKFMNAWMNERIDEGLDRIRRIDIDEWIDGGLDR